MFVGLLFQHSAFLFFLPMNPTGSERRLQLTPLGEGSFGDSSSRLNDRLPEEFQHLSGAKRCHGARSFVTTNAIRAGLSDAAVCAVTKHRDPSSLLTYHAVNTESLNRASLAITKMMNERPESSVVTDLISHSDEEEWVPYVEIIRRKNIENQYNNNVVSSSSSAGVSSSSAGVFSYHRGC